MPLDFHSLEYFENYLQKQKVDVDEIYKQFKGLRSLDTAYIIWEAGIGDSLIELADSILRQVGFVNIEKKQDTLLNFTKLVKFNKYQNRLTPYTCWENYKSKNYLLLIINGELNYPSIGATLNNVSVVNKMPLPEFYTIVQHEYYHSLKMAHCQDPKCVLFCCINDENIGSVHLCSVHKEIKEVYYDLFLK